MCFERTTQAGRWTGGKCTFAKQTSIRHMWIRYRGFDVCSYENFSSIPSYWQWMQYFRIGLIGGFTYLYDLQKQVDLSYFSWGMHNNCIFLSEWILFTYHLLQQFLYTLHVYIVASVTCIHRWISYADMDTLYAKRFLFIKRLREK